MSRPIRDRSQCSLNRSTEPNNDVPLTVIPEARPGTMMANLAMAHHFARDCRQHNNQHSGKFVAVVGDQTGRPTIRLCIHGLNVTALVDTGTSCSLMQ